jgi:hypothetical protein
MISIKNNLSQYIKKRILLTLSIVIVSFLGAVIVPPTVSAAEGDVVLSPPTHQIHQGDSFIISTLIDTGDKDLGAFQFNLTFDPAKVTIDTTQGTTSTQGLTAGADAMSYAMAANANNITAGQYAFNGITFENHAHGANQELVRIHMKGLSTFSTGNSGISIQIVEIANDIGELMQNGTVGGSTIAIQQTSCTATDGSTVQNGGTESRTRFQSNTVPYGEQCQQESQTRTCTDTIWGDWNGSYTFQACSPEGDTTLPSLMITGPIPTPANDTTPQFSFNSSETGTITYSGSCTSLQTQAMEGNNTIILNELTEGTYSDCSIVVTDGAGNASSPLPLGTFTINIQSPIRADINEDGGVSVADAQLILRKAMNLSVVTWPLAVTAGDVNCSGTINVADAQLTLRRAMNLEVGSWCDTNFPTN